MKLRLPHLEHPRTCVSIAILGVSLKIVCRSLFVSPALRFLQPLNSFSTRIQSVILDSMVVIFGNSLSFTYLFFHFIYPSPQCFFTSNGLAVVASAKCECNQPDTQKKHNKTVSSNLKFNCFLLRTPNVFRFVDFLPAKSWRS